MSDIGDLERAWRKRGDGESGHAFGEALEAEGRIAEAAVVFDTLINAGYLVGLVDLAWLEHDRGDLARSHALLARYLELDDAPDESTDVVAGVLGHWLWCDDATPDAEALLRRGVDAYPTARADLAHLLRASARAQEAEEILRIGVTRDEVESFLPLANLLEEDGRIDEATEILRYGYALGDAHSAYNLFLILDARGDAGEAREWLWRAAERGDDKAIDVLAHIDL